MKQQGYTNSQIIASLQRDGYTSSQIFDALNQVEMRMGTPIDGAETPEMPPSMQQQSLSQPSQYEFPSPSTPMPSPMLSMQLQQAPRQMQNQGVVSLTNDAAVEELVESVIDEKWNDLVKDLNKIIDWKNSTENRMSALEQQFKDLKDQFDRLHGAVVGKVNEYDKNIQDVGSEIKAMEKVFSKVLPAFTDSVSELSQITERLRTAKK